MNKLVINTNAMSIDFHMHVFDILQHNSTTSFPQQNVEGHCSFPKCFVIVNRRKTFRTLNCLIQMIEIIRNIHFLLFSFFLLFNEDYGKAYKKYVSLICFAPWQETFADAGDGMTGGGSFGTILEPF